MTISVLQQVQAENAGGAVGGLAITTTASSALHIIITVGNGENMAATPLTNTGTALTYVLLDNLNDTVNNQRVVHYYANSVPAQTTTITPAFTGSPSFTGIIIKEIGGTTGYDVTANAHAGQVQATPGTGSNGVSSGNTPSLTTQPALVSGVTMATAAVSASTIGTGFTNDTTGNIWQFGSGVNNATSESKRVTSTAAQAATFTASSNDTRLTVAAVFTENTGGSSPTLTVENATFTVTGQSVTMDNGMPVVNATLTLTGQTVGSIDGLGILVDDSSITLAGQDVTLLANANITLPVTNSQLTFELQDVLCQVIVPWDETVLTLTGQDVTLIAGVSSTLAVTEGTLSLSGQVLNFILDEDYILAVTNASVTLTGQDVTLSALTSFTLQVDQSSLALAGQDVGLFTPFSTGTGGGRRTRKRAVRRLINFGR